MTAQPTHFLRFLLYTAFFLTGVSVAAPGAMLPLLFPLWRLTDASAGVLLFAFFVGSSLGSLGARGPLRIAFGGSCLLTGLAALFLGWRGSLAPPLLLGIFGFGLGVCMTSVSLQRSRAVTDRRVAEMAKINLIWAAGALTGPWLCLRVAAGGGPGRAFLLLGAVFLALAVLVVFSGRAGWSNAPTTATAAPQGRRATLRSVLALLLFIPLTTGLESATGGWLTTYASRTGVRLAAGVGLVSVFWAGLLLCRLVYSSRRVAAHTGLALRGNTLMALAGVVLLWTGHPLVLSFLGALLLGWGLGSLYPIALALLLGKTELGNAGFLIAGIGSASLPLLTGFVAQAARSVRAGIGFLALPGLLLAVLGWRIAARQDEGRAAS